MKNILKFLLVATLLVVLAACGGKNDNNASANNKENEVENNNNEANENNEQENEDNEENEPANEEEPSFADEVTVQNVTEILLDLEETDLDEHVLIEHENKRYVEQEYITSLLDYEVTYDEANNLVEIYEGKGDFTYEPNHTDDGGALMSMSQIYDERLDDYIDTDEEIEDYGIIEFDDKLYLPVRFVNTYMETPVHYKRRDGIVELGEASEKTNIHDYAVEFELQGRAVATESSNDVTIEGENYEKAIKIEGINSAKSELYTRTYGQFSNAEGFIYNKSKDEEITVFIGDYEETVDEEVTIKPREIYEFKIDMSGYRGFYVNVTAEPGADETAIIVGDFY